MAGLIYADSHRQKNMSGAIKLQIRFGYDARSQVETEVDQYQYDEARERKNENMIVPSGSAQLNKYNSVKLISVDEAKGLCDKGTTTCEDDTSTSGGDGGGVHSNVVSKYRGCVGVRERACDMTLLTGVHDIDIGGPETSVEVGVKG